MRIVHIATGFLGISKKQGGAIQRRIVDLAEQQARLGHDVTVIGPVSKDHALDSAIKLIQVPTFRRLPGWLALYALMAAVAARRTRPDVVHAHAMPLCGPPLGSTPSLLHVDWFQYDSSKRWARPFVRRSILAFSAIAGVSDYNRSAIATYWQLPLDDVQVLHNCCDIDQFQPPASEREHNRIQFGYLGRINDQKGSDTLGKATTRLRNEGLDNPVLAAGPLGQFGAEARRPSAEDYATAAAVLGPDVEYLGVLPESDVVDYLQSLDVVVMPTRSHEMFGMAVIEAMACGCIPLVSDCGSLPEIAGENAHIFEAGDPQHLAAEMKRLHEASRAELQHQSIESRKRAEYFRTSRVVADALELYEGIIQ